MLIEDLIMGSKVRSTLSSMAMEGNFLSSPAGVEAALARPAVLLIVDAGNARLRPIEAIGEAKAKGVRVLAFGPHTDAAALSASRQAGADQVVPRSVFSARLAELIESLVRARAEG